MPAELHVDRAVEVGSLKYARGCGRDWEVKVLFYMKRGVPAVGG